MFLYTGRERGETSYILKEKKKGWRRNIARRLSGAKMKFIKSFRELFDKFSRRNQKLHCACVNCLTFVLK